MWPTMVSFRLVLEFQRGLTTGFSETGVIERRLGVVDMARFGVMSRRPRGRFDM